VNSKIGKATVVVIEEVLATKVAEDFKEVAEEVVSVPTDASAMGDPATVASTDVAFVALTFLDFMFFVISGGKGKGL
jgi:hypothetical protein